MAPNQLNNVVTPAAGLLFTGGRSARMGVDKALIDVEGEPLVSRVLRALDVLVPVVIVGGRQEDFGDLDALWCADLYPGEGPLGALISGMHQVRCDTVVAVACDLPHLTSNSVEVLVNQLVTSGGAVAVPLVAGRHQWHVAAWRRDQLAILEDAFLRGVRSLYRVAAELGVVSVVFADSNEFLDVDTPDDLSRAFPE